MQTLDWIVLSASLIFIVVYGVWKGRGSEDITGYFLANRSMRWYTVLLSIMATQASAITFLSAPGQAYVDGMRFVQFYFGLPIGMVILSITAIPIYHRLKVHTAYEYLENRFDLKTRTLASLLFLAGRGLAAGLTIYAPALIFTVILGWDIHWTNLIIGTLVIIYTASGGTKAVNWTHFYQMMIIMFGMFAAFFMIVINLPDGVSLLEATHLAGKLGRLNAIDFGFDWNNRYNIWSGILGGMFLQLSYFGTDQSQVQRYLTGESITQSRLGLLLNGIVKIPMQFFILFIGAMLFAFYQFEAPPVFFNSAEIAKVQASDHAREYNFLEVQYKQAHEQKKLRARQMVLALQSEDEKNITAAQQHLLRADADAQEIRNKAIALMQKNDPGMDPKDTNYIFLSFVTKYLPAGLVGLIIAAIIAASMSSTSGELNALASTSIVDIYKRMLRRKGSDRHYLTSSKIATVLWGIYAILFAEYASRLGSLIEAVNILGSLTYGPILGIFLVGFYFKKIGANATFYGAFLAEAAVLYCFFFTDIAFLWYNPIGCLGVIFFAYLLQPMFETQTS
ncbi:MAG: sodium:solute symporter [Calditrichae bacterium]|nr:sodium:solute symporter [Calditrichia bacterium]